MRRTDFSFLPDRKRLLYEQIARSYRLQERRKNPPFAPFEKRLLESKIAVVSVTGAYPVSYTHLTLPTIYSV